MFCISELACGSWRQSLFPTARRSTGFGVAVRGATDKFILRGGIIVYGIRTGKPGLGFATKQASMFNRCLSSYCWSKLLRGMALRLSSKGRGAIHALPRASCIHGADTPLSWGSVTWRDPTLHQSTPTAHDTDASRDHRGGLCNLECGGKWEADPMEGQPDAKAAD